MNEPVDFARLRWRCRRGMLELDELLLGYLDRSYAAADAAEQSAFRELLEYPDQTLFDIFFNAVPAEPRLLHVIDRVRRAAGA